MWRNVLVVLNPAAWTTDRRDVRAAIEETLGHRTSTAYALHETARTDNVTEVVTGRLAEGFDLVVASGGRRRRHSGGAPYHPRASARRANSRLHVTHLTEPERFHILSAIYATSGYTTLRERSEGT